MESTLGEYEGAAHGWEHFAQRLLVTILERPEIFS